MGGGALFGTNPVACLFCSFIGNIVEMSFCGGNNVTSSSAVPAYQLALGGQGGGGAILSTLSTYISASVFERNGVVLSGNGGHAVSIPGKPNLIHKTVLSSGGLAAGGALFVEGALTLISCSFSGNNVSDSGNGGENIAVDGRFLPEYLMAGSGGTGCGGGAIFWNTADTTIMSLQDSNFTNNLVTGVANGGSNSSCEGGSAGEFQCGSGGAFAGGGAMLLVLSPTTSASSVLDLSSMQFSGNLVSNVGNGGNSVSLAGTGTSPNSCGACGGKTIGGGAVLAMPSNVTATATATGLSLPLQFSTSSFWGNSISNCGNGGRNAALASTGTGGSIIGGGGLLATGTIALTLQSCLMQENEVTSSGNGGGFNPILPPPIVVPTPGATTQSGGYLVGGGAVLSMFSVAVTATNFTGNAVRMCALGGDWFQVVKTTSGGSSLGVGGSSSGGGAILAAPVFNASPGPTSVFLFTALFIGNEVDKICCGGNQISSAVSAASGGSYCGGGALMTLQSASLVDTTFENNAALFLSTGGNYTVSTASSSASGGIQSGGGAVFVSSLLDQMVAPVLSVVGCTLESNKVSRSGEGGWFSAASSPGRTVGSPGNFIGGGAILSTGGQLGSGFSSPQVFISESDFLDNTVVSCSNQGSYTTWTSQPSSPTAPAFVYTGGGAVLTTTTMLSIVDSTLQSNSVTASGLGGMMGSPSTAVAGDFVGGGALFVDQPQGPSLSVTSNTFQGNRVADNGIPSTCVNATDGSTAGRVSALGGNMIGGGAIFVSTLPSGGASSAASVSIQGNTFTNNRVTNNSIILETPLDFFDVSPSQSLSGSNVGGGAIFLPLSTIPVVIGPGNSYVQNSVTGLLAIATSKTLDTTSYFFGNLVGGGGILSLSSQMAIVGDVFELNMVATNFPAGFSNHATSGNVFFGGGAVLCLSCVLNGVHLQGNVANSNSLLLLSGGGAVLAVQVSMGEYQGSPCNLYQNQANESLGGGLNLFSGLSGISATSGSVCSGAVMTQNSASLGGGAVYIGIGTTARFVSLMLDSNSAASTGGGILSAGTFDCENCHLLSNTATQGGAVAATSGSVIMSSSKLWNNQATLVGGAFSIGGATTCYLNDTMVQLNRAVTGGGALSLTDMAFLNANNTIFLLNMATKGSGGAVSMSLHSSCSLESTHFSANVAMDGGALSLSDLTSCTLQQCLFLGNLGDLSGGAASLSKEAVMRVHSTSFVENRAESGGAVVASGSSAFSGTLSSFFNNTAELTEELTISLSTGGGFLLSETSSVTLQCVTASGNLANGQDGGGFASVSGNCSLTIRDCSATLPSVISGNNATAGSGGGISTYSLSIVNISNSFFKGNFASQQGGGLYAGGNIGRFRMYDTTFVKNSASNGGGAAVFIQGERPSVNIFGVSNVVLQENVAFYQPTISGSGGGGGLFITGTSLQLRNNSFIINGLLQAIVASGNTATYGHDLSSSPCSVAESGSAENMVTCKSSALQIPQQGISQRAASEQTPSPISILPGEAVQEFLGVYDYWGNLISTLDGFLVSIQCSGCAVENTIASSVGGLVPLSLEAVTMGPNQLNVTVSSHDGANFLVPSPAVVLSLQLCINGTGFIDGECQVCPRNSYSFGNAAFNQSCISCTGCPGSSDELCFEGENLSCVGGSTVFVQNIFWTFPLSYYEDGKDFTIQTFLCPYDYCDRGAPAEIGALCKTDSNREESSALCGECKDGYSEWNNECVACDGVNVGDIMAILFKIWGITFLQHILSQGQTVAATKILLFMVQTVSLLFYPNIALLSFSRLVRLWLPSFGDSCPFPTTGLDELLIRMLTPFTYFGFLWLTYGLHKLLALLQHCVDPKEKWRTSTNKAYRFWGKIMSWSRVEFYIRTTLLLVIGAYQGLVETSLLIFSCQRVGSDSVLLLLPSVSCEHHTGEYESLRAASGFLLAILVALPIVSIFLIRFLSRHEGFLRKHRRKIEPLFINYRPAFHWWESYQTLRRLILSVIFFQLANTRNLSMLHLVLWLAYSTFLAIHLVCKPYISSLNNMLETGALTVLTIISVIFISQIDINTQIIVSLTLLGVMSFTLVAPQLWRIVKVLRRQCTRIGSRSSSASRKSGLSRAQHRLDLFEGSAEGDDDDSSDGAEDLISMGSLPTSTRRGNSHPVPLASPLAEQLLPPGAALSS